MYVKYTIIFVSDMKKSIAFYRDLLGLPLKFESPEWTEFSTEGSTIALHLANRPNSEKKSQPQKTGGHCRPGIAVSDLDSLHKKLLKAGVSCIQEPKEEFGFRLAQYSDPDGLAISFSEERDTPAK
jgi:lactoylglutathione lyase